MSTELAQKIEKHEIKIGVLEHSFTEVVESLKDNTKSNHELIKTLAIYTTKHDGLENRMKELQIAQANTINIQLEHSNHIAAMKPVVDNLRGFIWKVASVVLLGGGGVAAVVTALISLSTKSAS